MTTLTQDDVRHEMARRSFHIFQEYTYIMDPPPGRGLIKMEVWPHLAEVARNLATHRLIIWMKSRQIGASWEMADYDLWTAQYHDGAKVLLFSQGEPEAQEKLDKCRIIYNHLPQGLQTPLITDNRGELIFDNGSSIRALPSTAKAGRSTTGTLVDMDEADYHEYFDANYNAVKPILDDNGGQLVLTSTSNPDTIDSLFKRLYTGAPGNGFYPIFYGWNVRENRTEEWYAARQLEYDDPYKFLKEYPGSAEEALAPPSTLAAFNLEILDRMREEDVREPVKAYGNTRIFRQFRPGGKYSAGSDTAHGVGLDASVTVILDIRTGSAVADVTSAHLSPEEFAYESVQLLKVYDNPIWCIEDNDWGILTIRKAQALRYPRLYWRNDKQPGWRTNVKTKTELWGELIEAVGTNSLVIFAKDGLAEFYNCLRDPASGKVHATRHDDYPMAIGLAWYVRAQAYQSRHETPIWLGKRPKPKTARW